jgi:glucokinase
VAALGEQRHGAGRGSEDIFYVTVSTGVGGGWILNGRPWRGAQGLAGEIGHMVVDPTGPRCLCGKQGCVERLASGPFMAADARAALQANPDAGPRLRALVNGDLAAIDGRQIAIAANEGEGTARELLLRGARALGVGLGNAINLVNPQRVVLGGGVTKSGDLWWAAVRTTARATALPEFEFDIIPAALGDDAPLWGAVELARAAAGDAPPGARV